MSSAERLCSGPPGIDGSVALGGGNCKILLLREGVMHCDRLVMILYTLQEAEETVLQELWYADDAAMVGPVKGITQAMRLLAGGV
eukprot:scaffold9034_cov43-Attheya_sp.AAC.1